MDNEPLVRLNIRQSNQRQNVQEVKEIHQINSALVPDEMQVLLAEVNSENEELKMNIFVSTITQEIIEEKNEDRLPLSRWIPSAVDLDNVHDYRP